MFPDPDKNNQNHNWYRIRRLLAHLNLVGFRRYAVELVKFLETEIYDEPFYYQNNLAHTSKKQKKKI